MLTPEGATLLWAIAAGRSDDTLAGGSIQVRDAGENRSRQELDAEPVINGATVTLAATFDEQSANFEWAAVEVLSHKGVVVDREIKDNGRKTAGAVWTLEAVLELGVPA